MLQKRRAISIKLNLMQNMKLMSENYCSTLFSNCTTFVIWFIAKDKLLAINFIEHKYILHKTPSAEFFFFLENFSL